MLSVREASDFQSLSLTPRPKARRPGVGLRSPVGRAGRNHRFYCILQRTSERRPIAKRALHRPIRLDHRADYDALRSII